MNAPKNPIEDLIKQMSLKQPSQSLDQRIEGLSRHPTVSPSDRHGGGQNGPGQHGRRQYGGRRYTTLVSALSLCVGIGLGWAISSAWRMSAPSKLTESPSAHALDHQGSIALRIGDAVDPSQRSNADDSKKKTRILEDRLVRTREGELKRIYRTATPRDFWYFDEESQQFQSVTISVPRVIVTTPHGI